MNIYLGNISFSEVEEKLGYKLTEDDKIIWDEHHSQNADLKEKESCFHVFDIPRCIVFKGEKAKKEISKRAIGSQILWTCKSHKPLTKNDAEILQAASGYLPLRAIPAMALIKNLRVIYTLQPGLVIRVVKMKTTMEKIKRFFEWEVLKRCFHISL